MSEKSKKGYRRIDVEKLREALREVAKEQAGLRKEQEK